MNKIRKWFRVEKIVVTTKIINVYPKHYLGWEKAFWIGRDPKQVKIVKTFVDDYGVIQKVKIEVRRDYNLIELQNQTI